MTILQQSSLSQRVQGVRCLRVDVYAACISRLARARYSNGCVMMNAAGGGA